MPAPARRLLAAVAAALTATMLPLSPGAASPSAGSAPSPARASAPVSLRIVTANLAFRGNEAVRRDWRKFGDSADVVLVQEAKNVNLRSILGDQWIVRQSLRSSAEQGSAVVVRRSAVAKVGDLHLRLGTPANGCGPDGDGGIQARYLAQVAVTASNGRKLRVIALHMPPGRCQDGTGSSYNLMATNVKNVVNATTTLTVLGADWNKTVDTDPNNIGAATGLRPYGPKNGKRIDGFYTSPALVTSEPYHLATTGSDHRPVKAKITVPGA